MPRIDRAVKFSPGEGLAPDVAAAALQKGLIPELTRVSNFTKELFPGASTVAVVHDPEIPGDTHFVFNVAAEASLDEILSREVEWHRKLREVSEGSSRMFRLSIDAQ